MNNIKVLIVEDEFLIAEDIKMNLKAKGCSVVKIVDNCKETLKMLDAEDFNLVLLDIKIKGEIDGIQTASFIRERYHVPIIFLTSFSDSDTIEKAKYTEPDGYIIKPIDKNELFSTIEIVLYKYELNLKLIETKELLSITLENIEDTIITTGDDLIIRYINPAGTKLLNIKNKNIDNIQLSKLIKIFDFENILNEYELKKLIKSQIKQKRFLLKQYKSKNYIPVELTVAKLEKISKIFSGWLFNIKNIGDHLKIEEMQSRLASIVESSGDAVIGVDLQGVIISWNDGATKIFGFKNSETLNKNIYFLTPKFIPNEIPELLDSIIKTHEIKNYETLRETKRKEIINVAITISPIYTHDKKICGFSFIAKDITEKKKMEKEILEIGNRERTRIGQDLHDSLGQQLTGIALQAKVIEKKIKNKSFDSALESIREVSGMITDAIDHTKNIAKTLVPVVLKAEGIELALQGLAVFAEKYLKIKIICSIEKNVDTYDINIADNLYKIAQEAINNAKKHSNATQIHLELKKEASELILTIRDNGKGLKLKKPPGLGLKIMKYRADQINGQFSIISNANSGTTIKCRVPIKESEHK